MWQGSKWLAAASSLALAACASTGPVSPAAAIAGPEVVAGSDFSPLESGGIWHPASKGQCPEELAGFDFAEPTLFKPDGTDVGCQYASDQDGGHLTVYFYLLDRVPTAAAAAQEAGDAIVQRFPEAEYLEDDSSACTTAIDLMSGLGGMLDGNSQENTTITVGKTPCLLFRVNYGVAAVATDKIGPWHLKVRITRKAGDGDIADVISRMTETMQQEAAWMAGKPAINIERLLRPSREGSAPAQSET
ncbi:MAG: hypothetical protein R3C13_02705 [Hyphomonas sp.]|uniref:hypothetical protein n=1 Tax=Hyphomonas sp. TaxID=87 RepID=UPI0035294E22